MGVADDRFSVRVGQFLLFSLALVALAGFFVWASITPEVTEGGGLSRAVVGRVGPALAVASAGFALRAVVVAISGPVRIADRGIRFPGMFGPRWIAWGEIAKILLAGSVVSGVVAIERRTGRTSKIRLRHLRNPVSFVTSLEAAATAANANIQVVVFGTPIEYS